MSGISTDGLLYVELTLIYMVTVQCAVSFGKIGRPLIRLNELFSNFEFFKSSIFVCRCAKPGCCKCNFNPTADASLDSCWPVCQQRVNVSCFHPFLKHADKTTNFRVISSVPNYLIWIKYISWFYYTNEAVSIKYWTSRSSIPCTRNTTLVETGCVANGCFKDGRDVLTKLLNFEEVEELEPNGHIIHLA
jgi:hypothetical protein